MIRSADIKISLLGCLLYVRALSLNFVTDHSFDEPWTEGSTVKLVCTNNPYTGVNRFLYDFAIVSSCLASTCNIVDNDNGTFVFENDIDKGIFTWVVNTVKMAYNKKMFDCFDGTEHKSFNATVTELGNVSYSGRLLAVYISSCFGAVTPVVLAAVVICKKYSSCQSCRNCFKTRKPHERQETIFYRVDNNNTALKNNNTNVTSVEVGQKLLGSEPILAMEVETSKTVCEK